MAESNQEPMSMEAFRAKKAAASTSDKPTASPSKVSANSSSSSSNSAQTRPASASKTNSAKRSVSSENLAGDRYGPALDQRQNKVKLLREKQAEERRRKNEERRLAFEERRRQKEEEEKERWTALKEQADKHNVPKANTSALKPGSGRKLPSVPSSESAAKRPGSAVETPSRPSSLPRPLTRPSSANPAKSPSRSSGGSLSGGSTPKESPATTSSLQPKSSLQGKSVSASNLHTPSSRRSNGSSSQQRPSSGTKSRARTSSVQASDKPASKNSSSRESLLPPGGKLTKSHSTSSLHKIGQHKPAADKSHTTESKPKAGVTDEATAKQALAERRKKAREEAERQAALDKERQEAERLKREEEERIRAEEEAREEARMRELAEMLRKQEEERLQAAAEEKERIEREEAERAAVEKKRKEEEEQKTKEEEERKAQEEEERRKQEEAARLERKRRVEQIMSRTRKNPSPTTTEESNASAAGNEAKELDPDDTKRKVNEILQKVKDSQSSPSHLADNNGGEDEQGNNNEFKTIEAVNDRSESTSLHVHTQDQVNFSSTTSPVHLNGIHSSALHSFDSESPTEQALSPSPPLITTQQESAFTVVSSRFTNNEHEKETVSFQYNEESTVTINKENCGVNGTDQVSETENLSNAEGTVRHSPETKEDPALDNSQSVNQDFAGEVDEEMLWLKIEATMKARESCAIETLENLGVVAEGDDDDDSEEGQLWKVVEGNAHLAEVV